MKKTIFFLIGLILVGTLAYFTGYYIYTSENPETEVLKPMELQKAVPLSDEDIVQMSEEYYVAKTEQDMLLIYQMPDGTIYDSVKLSSLHFTESETQELVEGIVFQSLTELFGFLENSMS